MLRSRGAQGLRDSGPLELRGSGAVLQRQENTFGVMAEFHLLGSFSTV